MSEDGSGSETSVAGPSTARWRPLPRSTFRAVEYPGPMQSPAQILRVVAQDDVDECFNAPLSESKVLEMRYRPQDRTAVPVRGTRVPTQKVLVKVVRRRRRGDGSGDSSQGVFTADVVGSIPQTVRFRSMADYQYTPAQEGHIAQITQSLLDLDYDAILDYQVPPMHEQYTEAVENGPFPARSTMELQPTPMASQRVLPNAWNFKMGPGTVLEEVWDDEAQEPKKRYVNKSRAVGLAVQAIAHGDSPVPEGPERSVRDRIPKLDKRILKRMQELFQERPVWLRYAMLSQFNETDRYEIENNKMYFPATCFTYKAGPFWKVMVRFGYDPCADPEAFKYQRVFVYLDVKRGRNNVLNTSTADMEDDDDPKRKPFWWEHEQERRIAEGLRPPLDPGKVHIFNGELLHQNKSDYQLLDITDPEITDYIWDPVNRWSHCDPHSGWYRPLAFEMIKALLRVRYAHLRDNNEPAPRSEFQTILDAYEQAEGVMNDRDKAETFTRRIVAARRDK